MLRDVWQEQFLQDLLALLRLREGAVGDPDDQKGLAEPFLDHAVVDAAKLDLAEARRLGLVGPVGGLTAVAVHQYDDVVPLLLAVIPGQPYGDLKLRPVGVRQSLAKVAALMFGGLKVALGQLGEIQRGLGSADLADPVHAEVMIKGLAADRAESGLRVMALIAALPAADETAVLPVEARSVIADETAERAESRFRIEQMPVRRRLGRGLLPRGIVRRGEERRAF